MSNAFIQYQGEMSRERFRQEAALVVLRSLMEAAAAQVLARFQDAKPEDLMKVLGKFEEHASPSIGRIAESIADHATAAIGPDSIPARLTAVRP